jgi:hypothetical protein
VLDFLKSHAGPAVGQWLLLNRILFYSLRAVFLLKFPSDYSLYAKLSGIFRAKIFSTLPSKNCKTLSVSSALQARTVILSLQLSP